MAAQRCLARRRGIQSVHSRRKDADIAGRGAQRQIAQCGTDQGENLGIRCCRIGAVKDLESGLEIFAGAFGIVFLSPEHLACIGIASGLGPVRHMHLNDRHGEIGAQHLLAAHRVRGDIGSGADILAVKVQQDICRLQDRRVHDLRACRFEQRAQA